MENAKPKRQPRWSDDETSTLLLALLPRREKILQISLTSCQNHNRIKAWKEVAEEVTANNPGGAARNPAACRKRWAVGMEMDIMMHYLHVAQIKICTVILLLLT